MICLDTNYLILGLVPDTVESDHLRAWFTEDRPLITPAVAWYEFLCGPVTEDQISTIHAFLSAIVPFRAAEATAASRLFNAVGRKRTLRVDAMIAATAITTNTQLATGNTADFARFQPHGLTLAE